MYEINIENKIVLYLSHQELINKSYKENIKSNGKYYTLKDELFYFDQKVNKNLPLKTRKRKSDPEPDECESNAELKNLIEQCLFQIKQKNDILINEREEKRLNMQTQRYWEEKADFPIMNGGNNTEEFKTATFTDKEYILPPKSRFYNNDIKILPQLLPTFNDFDLIVIDPPWKNKYIRRLKKARQDLAYEMLNNDELAKLPIQHMTHSQSIVCVWCTNSKQHQKAIETDFFPKWNLKLFHKMKWLKLNTSGNLISEVSNESKKQPYEELFIGISQDAPCYFAKSLQDIRFFCSIPSIIHSHKPPIMSIFEKYLPNNPNCLELFARYLQPGFTSIGLQVLKLMDSRLYCSNLKLEHSNKSKA